MKYAHEFLKWQGREEHVNYLDRVLHLHDRLKVWKDVLYVLISAAVLCH
jgi:hypothetical protein